MPCAASFSLLSHSQVGGLLPPRITSLDAEVGRSLRAVRSAGSPLDAFRLLVALKETNGRVFYALLQRHVGESGACTFAACITAPNTTDKYPAVGRLLPRCMEAACLVNQTHVAPCADLPMP